MLKEADKELFLRDKIYSLYVFLTKTIFTISSAALAFSIGVLNFESGQLHYTSLLYLGWLTLVFTIILTVGVIESGLKTYYAFMNNLAHGKSEVCKVTESLETKLVNRIYLSFAFFIAGVVFILGFVALNI